MYYYTFITNFHSCSEPRIVLNWGHMLTSQSGGQSGGKNPTTSITVQNLQQSSVNNSGYSTSVNEFKIIKTQTNISRKSGCWKSGGVSVIQVLYPLHKDSSMVGVTILTKLLVLVNFKLLVLSQMRVISSIKVPPVFEHIDSKLGLP